MLMLLVFRPHFEWQGSWPVFTLEVPLRWYSLQLDKPHQSGLTSAVLSKANCPWWISRVLGEYKLGWLFGGMGGGDREVKHGNWALCIEQILRERRRLHETKSSPPLGTRFPYATMSR